MLSECPQGQDPYDAAEHRLIQVSLHTFAGAVMQLAVEREATVATLKAKVAKEFKVPRRCQIIAIGVRSLTDADPLQDLLDGGKDVDEEGTPSLNLSLIISLDSVQHELATGVPDRINRALIKDVGELGRLGGKASLAMVLEQMRHHNAGVKIAATMVMAQVAERGDPEATAGLIGLLDDDHLLVRQAALKSLAAIAARGDQLAVQATILRVQDDWAEVRVAALQTACQICERGDPDVLAAIRKALEETNPSVQSEAERALSLVELDGEARFVIPPAPPELLQEGDGMRLRWTAGTPP